MSLFQNLYKYQKTDKGNHQQENYLTELLAYVLQHDEAFRKGFFVEFLPNCTIENLEIEVSTQRTYKIPETENSSRPDIIIKGFDSDYNLKLLLFIEDKIGSSEGWRYIITEDEAQDNNWQSQLSNYSKVLKEAGSKDLQTHLIYLTRNFEIRYEQDLTHIRWYEIYSNFLKENIYDALSITGQFKQYIEDCKFDKSHQFETLDNFDYYGKDKYILDEVLKFTNIERRKKFKNIGSIPNPGISTGHGLYRSFAFHREIGIHIGFTKGDKPNMYISINDYKFPRQKWDKIKGNLENRDFIEAENKWATWNEGGNIWLRKSFPLQNLPIDREHTTFLQIWIEKAMSELSEAIANSQFQT